MIYKLYNGSQMIIDEIELADTFFKRLRGYMLYKEPPTKALAIKPCNSIHTYFMKFDIDVLFLDHEMMVVKKINALQKNKMIPPIKNAKYVIETSSGGFEAVQVGDVMSIC